MPLLPDAPEPRKVLTPDGLWVATYDIGDPDAPVVFALHGFASSFVANWWRTGWVRELTRAGYRIVSMDQRGHGASDKPIESSGYRMNLLVDDVRAVLDTYILDDVSFVGYSLGARVGWHAALELPVHIKRAVFGGIPDGDPLTRFRVDQARAFIDEGVPVEDRLTQAYLTMADATPGNDLPALVALVEGMRGSPQPDRANPPRQPALFAAGSEDRILPASRSLAEATPRGEFFEIPGRNHFNAPTSRHFRDAALEFLSRREEAEDVAVGAVVEPAAEPTAVHASVPESAPEPDDGSGASNGVRFGVAEAAHVGDERTTLLGVLQRQRELIAWKLRDASDDALRSVTTPTGLTLHGLVRHLTNVERSWLRDIFAGESGLVFDGSDDDPRGEWTVTPETTMVELLAEYAAEARRGDAVVAAASLDTVSSRDGFSLRWILLHLIEETARHLGHVDLLRELADGITGEEPQG